MTEQAQNIDDEREAVARMIADAQAHPDFPRPIATRPLNGDYRAADAVIAWRNRHRGPITDEMVTAAAQAIAFENHDEADEVDWPYLWDAATVARAALEAAEAAR